MYRFTTFGNEPRQQITMTLDDSSRVVFIFEYRANQLGWFFGYEYGDMKQDNIRLVTSFNMLRTYSARLPFGLRCDTQDGEEPLELDDFASGYATLYLLTAEDVNQTEGKYYAKVGTQV